MTAYVDMWRNYATFSGRTSRAGYWLAVLINFLIGILLAIPYLATRETMLILLSSAYSLAVLIPGIALTVRRLHDTGRSGWWYFIAAIPFIGALWLLVLLCLAGDQGDNKYGADPRQAASFTSVAA